MAVIQVRAAVERGRATLGHHADLRAGRTPVLGLVAAGKYFVFLYRVQADRRQLVAVIARVDVTDTIERQLVMVEALAVCRNIRQTAVSASGQVGRAHHTRGQTRKLQVTTAVYRQFLDFLSHNRVRSLRALRLELHHLRRNFNGLGYSANLESNVSDGNLVVGHERYVLARELSESCRRDGEIVSARQQLREHESPLGIRRGRE